jgi:hypothetical protein
MELRSGALSSATRMENEMISRGNHAEKSLRIWIFPQRSLRAGAPNRAMLDLRQYPPDFGSSS